MTPMIFSVVILSAFAWSLFDMSRKRLSDHLDAAPAVVWLALLQAPLFALAGMGSGWQNPPLEYWLPSIGGLILELFANLWFIRSVSLAPLSLAIPILSLTPVFSAGGGRLFLSEPTTLREGIGIAVIVAATFALGRMGASSGSSFVAERVKKGLWLMVVVAFLFAVKPIIDKYCLRLAPPSQHGFIQNLGIALALGTWLKIRKGPGVEMRSAMKSWGWLAAGSLFAALALFTQLWAIQFINVGIFEALKRGVGLLLALFLGRVVFGERVTKAKALIVLLMGIGVFILLW